MSKQFLVLRYLAVLVVLACAGPALAETALPPEKNPPGDIPDSQVFLNYAGPGFSIQVPEGWARADAPNGATFSDKYNTLEVTVAPAAAAPSVEEVKSTEAKALAPNGRAVDVTSIKEVKLSGGRAIRIDYSSNSAPNAVTNKAIRLEDVRFLLFGGGKLVTLDMSAPKGADNVDQWNLMANSIRLK